MSRRAAGFLLVALLFAAGCDSQGSEGEQERESVNAPAAQTLHAFYEAADRSDGKTACALLTPRGITQIVHVSSRRACVSTIAGLAAGSFSKVLEVEGVDEHGDDAFSVDAKLKGRSEGTYTVVKRDGRLLIDGFEPEEG